MTVLWWDFFGPEAEGTAEHFRRHLAERLAAEGIADAALSLARPRPGQVAVACRLREEDAVTVRRALRPRREEPAAVES